MKIFNIKKLLIKLKVKLKLR